MRSQIKDCTCCQCCKKCSMKPLSDTQITSKPQIMLIAKPMLKTFNCGAARVITPKEKLMSSMATTAAKETDKAIWNMTDPKKTSDCMLCRLSPSVPTGSVVKLRCSRCNMVR